MIEEFTVGQDRELDLQLARYDVEGSMAHITMLESIGLLKRMNSTHCSRGCARFSTP